ncbi:MAG TPA: protein kinase, partial [Chroococcales cyanobacterium]
MTGGGASDPLAFLAPAEEDDEIGRLAHYRVLRILGEGGMGIVLHAEDTYLERPVALKVIKPEFCGQPETRQRFIREARAMAQVKSDHVVTVYQVGQENDTCFIAMELLEGESLDSFIDAERQPSLSETLRIAREITQALAAAHSTGLIHRDIKPANVWLEPTGRIKLLDFGLARPQEVDFQLTHTGMVMGTPAYMAPEQARAEPLDERADLFSLGCLLYRMSSGRAPFSGDTLMALMMSLGQDVPQPPGYYNLQVPQALDELIMSLLEKKPGDRPQSALAVIETLLSIEGEAAAAPAAPAVTRSAGTPGSSSIYRPKPSILGHTTVPTEALSSQSVFVTREAEHRQVTVLICSCDLFESEDYLERVDADGQQELIRNFQQICNQEISDLGGTIIQKNDDSLIACFGYPTAHEDAGTRAARASLNIFESLEQVQESVRRSYKVEVDPWIILNTGPVIVEKKDDDISLVGEARNIAMRLKAVVNAGQIVCTEATQKMLYGNFECAELGEHKIKNLAEPVKLFQLKSAIEQTSAIKTATPAELSPLTGRDHELSLLKSRWEQASEGIGQVVHLIGEAGIGKSRLAHELKRHVLDSVSAKISDFSRAPILMEWYASPHFQNSGLFPIRSFFQRLLRFEREGDQSIQLNQLIEHLEKINLALPDVVPHFISLLGLPPDARFPSLVLSPVREREELFKALKDWFCAYCNDRPLLFIVEDLHWLDSSTLEFIEQFLTETAHNSFFMVLTSRPQYQPSWQSLPYLTSIALSHLTRAQVGDLLQKKSGRKLSPVVIDSIYERAGGVPLFIEEFIHMAGETQLLEQAAVDSGQLQAALTRAIPATLQDLIMARLERIEGDRELAQFAAALGREFSYELIAAAAGAEEPVLNIELNKLVADEVLYEKGRRPRSTFIFKNLLLQDALYNALIKSKRQQFHALIVESIEVHFPHMVSTQPELIAHHCTEAELTEKAVGYWLCAGLRSQELFANVEAIGHFKKGLDLIPALPESPARDQLELSLLNPLGSSYQVALGYSAAEVAPTFERAGRLCRRLGDKGRLFAVMWGNWTWNLVRAELNLCLQLTDEMLTVANETADQGMLMEA